MRAIQLTRSQPSLERTSIKAFCPRSAVVGVEEGAAKAHEVANFPNRPRPHDIGEIARKGRVEVRENHRQTNARRQLQWPKRDQPRN